KQPKTDYTYSASLSYRDTVTPERRVGSPNMSRKGLRGGSSITLTSPPYSSSSSRLELPTDSADNLSLRSRDVLRGGLSAYSDESDVEESHSVKTLRTSSVIKEVSSVSSTHSSKISHSKNLGKASNNISYGLDVESDVEEETPPHFARPIVRKGITSFLRKSSSQSSTSSETSASVNKNHTDGDYAFLNGGLHYRLGNDRIHSYTSEVEENNDNYYHSKGYKIKQNWWKEVYRTYSSYIYSRVYDTFSLLCSYVVLWSSHLISSVKRISSRSHSKRSPYFDSKTRSSLRDSVTISTTITSRRHIVTTYIENTLHWYEKKRAQSPFLWGWLPLFLLLLIPFLVYLFGFSEEGQELVDEIPHSVQESISVHDGASSYWQKLVVYIESFYTSTVSSVTSLYSSTISSVSNSVPLQSARYEYSSLFYYPFTFLSNSYSYLSENIQHGSSYVLAFLTETCDLLSNITCALWSGLLWTISTIWSYLLWIVIETWGLVLTLLSEGVKLPYKLFMLIPFMNQSAKDKLEPDINIDVKSQSEVPSASYQLESSDELVKQILLNPEIQTLIFRSVEKHENNLKEKLSTEMRENLESTLNNMKTEFVSFQKHASTLEEILSLKQHQENLQIKFKEVEDILKKLVLSHESTEESVNSLHVLKDAIGEMSLKIGKLGEEIEDIQKNHKSFEAEMRSCCRNASTLNIELVKDHVRVLLSDLLGLPLEGEVDNGNLSLRFKEWVGKYFVAKAEMENTLTDLNMKMQEMSNKVVHEETLKQTTEQVMKTVLDLLRAEMKSEYQSLKSDLNILSQSTDSAVSDLKIKIEEEKILSENDKVKIENVVEKFFNDNIDAHLLQLKNSISSDGNIDTVLRDKVLVALTPMIEETVEKNLKRSEIINVIDARVTNIVTEKMEAKFEQDKGKNINYASDSRGNLSYSLNTTDVEKIVRAALLKYDADKTGMADHALESAGGSIVSTRCTEEYQGHLAELIVFGYSLYRYSTNTPRSVIQSDRNPGQCYAFKGSEGYIVIQLAGPVRVTGFTLEHVPKDLTPYSTIDSAVKTFSVFGLQKTNEEGFNFGKFIFLDNGEPLQYFPVQNHSEEYFKYVELKILSNHGNMKFTCVYRFRVHGVREDLVSTNGV
ncbi:SUN domain-containing protein 2, partial [Armadillidium nasatum]